MKILYAIIIVSFVASSFFYYHITPDKGVAIQNLILETYSSLVLGVLIVIFGLAFENFWQKNKDKTKLNSNLILLKENLKYVFLRAETPWNFGNTSSSFYFDYSHINKIHDLLYENNQKWNKFILEYKERFSKDFYKNETLKLLNVFDGKFNQAEILGEKIDWSIKKLLLNPTLTAQKRSGYHSEIETFNSYYDQNYLFYRSAFIEIDKTRVFFDSIRYIRTPINMQQIDGAYIEAESTMNSKSEECKKVKKDIMALRKSRKELLKITSKIEKTL